MNWLRLARYDLRNGLLRWRYLFIPALFFFSCLSAWTRMSNARCVGSWMDYILCCFQGIPALVSMEDFSFPVEWLLVMGGCLFLNLDYPLNDLTEAGQQIIIRSGRKSGWFLSKCLWNLLSCVVYVLLGALMALGFTVVTGGEIRLTNTPGACDAVLQMYGSKTLDAGQTLTVAVILPTLTLMALNMLQMVLCLLVKPVFSFLICVCLLVVALFIDSPYVLGNGAISSRSGVLLEQGLEPVAVGLFCVAAIAVIVAVGLIRFDRMDHLRYEG